MDSDRYRPESRYAWFLVVVASVIMGMGAGALISISTFLKPIIADFGWLRGETAFAYFAGAIALGFGGIAMGYLSDRYSTRPVVIVGILCLGGSMLLLASQEALWQFYLYYILLGGFGVSALDAPLIANVGHWFNRNKGLALGLTTAGRALGQGFVPFASGLLISSSGWREAYTTLGIVSLMVLLPLAFFIRNPPGLREANEASRKAKPSDQDISYPVPPKLAIVWLSGAALFCCASMGTAMVHAVAIAQDTGMDADKAAGVILLIYVSGFFGRISFGKLSDHIGGIRSYWLASFGQTVLIFWFTQMQSLAGFYTHAVIFGFFMAGVMTGLIICVRELTPVHMRGMSTGIMFCVAWFGMGLGGYQGGFFFDLSGSYVIPYANAVAAGVINLIIVSSLFFYYRRKIAVLESSEAT
jgi:MFS family permease